MSCAMKETAHALIALPDSRSIRLSATHTRARALCFCMFACMHVFNTWNTVYGLSVCMSVYLLDCSISFISGKYTCVWLYTSGCLCVFLCLYVWMPVSDWQP